GRAHVAQVVWGGGRHQDGAVLGVGGGGDPARLPDDLELVLGGIVGCAVVVVGDAVGALDVAVQADEEVPAAADVGRDDAGVEDRRRPVLASRQLDVLGAAENGGDVGADEVPGGAVVVAAVDPRS